MTKLQERPTNRLEQRREQLIIENREHLSMGRWGQYAKNCQRIARISAELYRRERAPYRKEWEAYLP